MAEKQDIAMNAFQIVTDTTYIYGEKNSNQNKIAVEDLMKQIGILRRRFNIPAGGQVELPFRDGMLMIQNATNEYKKAVVTLQGDNNGIIISPASTINFFSEIEGKICVFNTGNNTNYIIKNKTVESKGLDVTFIK